MEYKLGIDLGTTTCAVAARWGMQVAPCAVGEDAATMPAIALRRADGTVLVGEEAERHSAYEPTLAARLAASGSDGPAATAVDRHGWSPVVLTRALLSAVIERATPPGDRPDHVVLTYPLCGGEGARARLEQAAVEVVGAPPTLVPEPIAAVAGLKHHQDLDEDTTLAVVDVGGASTDVTVVRGTPSSFGLIGAPASWAGLGGAHLDAAMIALVESAVGDVTSTAATADLERIRACCRSAKERLSSEPAVVVDVAPGHAHGQVEITREAFEHTAEPALAQVADLVAATIDDAGLHAGDLDGVLLTGGTARIPLLAHLLGYRTGLEVLTTDEPEVTTALGAAVFAERVSRAASPTGGRPLMDMAAPVAAAAAAAPGWGVPRSPDGHPREDHARADEPWDDAARHLDGSNGAGAPAGPWADTRTSVFDLPPEPGPEAAAGADDADRTRAEDVRRISASDGDPFAGRGSSLRHGSGARHRRDPRASDDDEPRPAASRRFVVGGVAASVVLLLIAAYAFMSGTDGDDGDVPAAQGALSTTTEVSTPTTDAAPTTGTPGVPTGPPAGGEPAADTTTTSDGRGGTPTSQPARPAAPGTPDSTPRPATPPTTSPRSSPPSSTPSTTAPPGGDRRDGNGDLLDLLGLG